MLNGGTVRCWGDLYNFSNQETDGVEDLPHLAGAVSVSIAFFGICALDALGTVRCLDSSARPADPILPAAVNELHGGFEQAMARTAAGAVYEWDIRTSVVRELTAP